jgi:hypothetical protein
MDKLQNTYLVLISKKIIGGHVPETSSERLGLGFGFGFGFGCGLGFGLRFGFGLAP